MEKGKVNEGARENADANNSSVSVSALCKDIVNVLDFMERVRNEENQDSEKIETLKLVLAFVFTYVHLSHSDSELFYYIMASIENVEYLLQSTFDHVGFDVVVKYDMHNVHRRLRNYMKDYINSCRQSKSSATMNEEQLDFLLLNLHHLSKFSAEKIFPSMTQYEILQNVCGNIRDFHGLKVNGYIEHDNVQYVLPQFQLLAERVGNFFWGGQNDGDSQLFNLAHLFLKIIPIELEVVHICYTYLKDSKSAEVRNFIKQLLETSPDILREYLIHLQEHMVNVITSSTLGARNIHVMIEFLLLILTDMPKDFIHHDKLFDLLERVGALTREISTLVHNLEEEKSRNEDSTSGTNLATLHFLENIEHLKGDLKHVYLKAPVGSSQLCFPMSDGPLFMHLLIRHLNDLLNSNAYSVALIKDEIDRVKKDLEFVRSFLMKIEQELYKDLRARVLDAAYEVKDVIDSVIVRDNGLLKLIFSLPNSIENIKLMKREVSDLAEEVPKSSSLMAVNSPNNLVQNKPSTVAQIIIGFVEETDWIIRKLTSGLAELDVISIFGMPGLGKTTLAYKVYNHKSVSTHFDVRAWCTVGQECNMEKLLAKIFNQVTGLGSSFSENVDDVADKLRRQLFGKRYLIVLDDLWDTSTWDELTRAFPRVGKGSRIILTTREKRVALHGKHHTDPLNLRFFRSEESWELLEKRVFGKESCPTELLDVGKELARNCGGLPLVADLIAGVIARKEKEKSVWLEVQNNLNSFILKNELEVMKVIELSYDHLPEHLKPCLLYLASYGKDAEYVVDRLKFLWCAEGFVEQTELMSVDEVMDIYLNNLISSSLVIVFNEIGDDLTCKIHDLVHDFCLIKAKEERIFDLISSSAPSSSSGLMSRQMTIDCDKHLDSRKNFVLFDSENKMHSGKHLYCLKITGNKLDNSLSDICHLRHLRLLTVLDLDHSFIKVNYRLLNEIGMLVHLRLLNIRIEVKSLPLSFSNLWNLEALSLDNDGPPLVLLPRIWNLFKLRVLCIKFCCFFDLDTDEPLLIAKDSKLESLSILEGLVLSYPKGDPEDIFKRFPNLQRLSFILNQDLSAELYWFPKLDFLNELESLRALFLSHDSGPSATATNQWNFHFPLSLKRLCLAEFPLTSDSLSRIARLPNLEELFLEDTIIQGGEWNMGEEDTFGNLKCLMLEDETIDKWEVGEESFPVLERLILKKCHKLEEIPPTFGDIDSLRSIRLMVCPHRLYISAQKIRQYVEDMTGNDKFQVISSNHSYILPMDQPI